MAGTERDDTDFERQLRENQRLVYQLAYGVSGNAADAEEVAQDVFLRAYRKFSSLRDRERFRAWVARMTWRLALNRQRGMARSLRRDAAWAALAPVAALPETVAGGWDATDRIREEIGRLPEKLRVVLLLSAMEGMETRAIALLLGIPEGTVRSRLHLARKQLLRNLMP